MHSPLRLDATLGIVRSGLWFGQVVTASVLLSVVVLADLALVSWAMGDTRVTAVVLVGGTLVCFATLRVFVTALLLTTRGPGHRTRGTATTGIRLVEALVACTASALVGLVALDRAVTGNPTGLAVAVGTSQFDTLVIVLAVLVVVHAAGSTVFETIRRTE